MRDLRTALRRFCSRIRAAKPDADFSLRPVGPRVRELLWEVMLQAKVIRQRPLPGLAHAFVFWGFCAFALVTVNHVAIGFGTAISDPRRILFPIGGGVRRAGGGLDRGPVRPPLLRAPEVAGRAVLRIRRDRAADFRADGRPTWAALATDNKLLWWTHTLALLVFLPLIPHTKHLHLVLSPFSIFFSRGGFAKIPPLAGDDDFGLDTGKDLTRIAALQAYSCVECGRCTEHCPANNTGKILDPKQIALGVRGYLNEFGPASEEPLFGKHLSQEAAFQCTTCGACEFQCPVGVEHVPIIVGLRRGAVNTGKWEDQYGTKLFLALERHGNALGFSSAERDKFIAKEQLPIFDGTQEYCLWLGCMGAYDPQGREIIAAFAQRDAAPGNHLRRSAKREVHGRSGPAAGQRSGVPAARRIESRNAEAEQDGQDRLHLPALRPHDFDRLAGVRPSPAHRTSQRISGAPPRPPAAVQRRKDRLSRSLLSRPLSQRL